MLKRYIYKGKEWQYEEGEQPKGAVELRPKSQKAADPPNKAVKPTNKSRAVRKK